MPFRLPHPDDPKPRAIAPVAEARSPWAEGAYCFSTKVKPASDLGPQYTPPPTGRPSLSPEQLVARDALDEQWFRPLTNKQRKFVAALFANGFDTAKAAREADPTLSSTKAVAKGKYWYKLASVKAAIEASFSLYQENCKVRHEELIDELKAIAFANLMDFHSINTRGDPVFTLANLAADDPRLRAIAELSIEDTKFGQRTRVKLFDKLSAIEKLIKLMTPPSEERATGITVQNINIIPVPAGQFLPAPTEPDRPLIDITPLPKASPALPTLAAKAA